MKAVPIVKNESSDDGLLVVRVASGGFALVVGLEGLFTEAGNGATIAGSVRTDSNLNLKII